MLPVFKEEIIIMAIVFAVAFGATAVITVSIYVWSSCNQRRRRVADFGRGNYGEFTISVKPSSIIPRIHKTRRYLSGEAVIGEIGWRLELVSYNRPDGIYILGKLIASPRFRGKFEAMVDFSVQLVNHANYSESWIWREHGYIFTKKSPTSDDICILRITDPACLTNEKMRKFVPWTNSYTGMFDFNVIIDIKKIGDKNSSNNNLGRVLVI